MSPGGRCGAELARVAARASRLQNATASLGESSKHRDHARRQRRGSVLDGHAQNVALPGVTGHGEDAFFDEDDLAVVAGGTGRRQWPIAATRRLGSSG
jgi:hypothetical protein